MAETGAPDADDLSKPSTRADGSNPQLRNASNPTEQSPFTEVIDIDDDEVEFEKEYTSFPVNAIQDSDDNSMYDEVSDITMHSFDTNHDDMLDFSQRLMPKQTPRRRQGWMKVEQDKLKAASPTPGRYHRPVDSLLAQEAGVRIGSSQQQTVLQGNGRHSQISLATDFSNERQISLDHRALG